MPSNENNLLPSEGVFLVDAKMGKAGYSLAIEPKSDFGRYSGTENDLWGVDFFYISESLKKRKRYKGWDARVSMMGVLGGLMDVGGAVPVNKKGRQMALASREFDVYLLEGSYKTHKKAKSTSLRKFCEEHSKDVVHGSTPYAEPHRYVSVVGCEVAEDEHGDDSIVAGLLHQDVTGGEAGKLFSIFGAGWVELYEVYVSSHKGEAFYIFANDLHNNGAVFKSIPGMSEYPSLKEQIDNTFSNVSL